MFIQILKFCPKTFFPHFTFESLLKPIFWQITRDLIWDSPCERNISQIFLNMGYSHVSKARWVFFFSKISYDNSNKSCFYKQVHFKMALWHFLLVQLIAVLLIAVLLIARLYYCSIRPRLDEAIKFGDEQGLALNSAGIKCRAWTVRVPYKNK